MGVNGVDSNRQTEVESRNRNESARKEAELAQKHSKEIARLQQENYERLKKLEADYQETLDKQRENSREALTDRDIKYQQEMEEFRKINRDKMMGLTTNYEDKLNRTKDEGSKALDNERRVTDSQKKTMADNFMTDIKEKEEGFKTALEKNREMQHTGLSKEKKEVESKYDEEIRALTRDREKSVDQLQDDLRSLRRAKSEQEKELKIGAMEQKEKLEGQAGSQMAKERTVSAEQLEVQRSAFNNSLDALRRKQQQAQYEERARNEEVSQSVADEVRDRQNKQFNQVERHLKEAEDGTARKTVEVKRLSDLEKNHLLDEVKDNLEASEKNRKDAINDSNEKHAKDLYAMTKKNGDLMHRQYMRGQEKINLLQVQHEDELAQKTSQLEEENQRLKVSGTGKDKQKTDRMEKDRMIAEDYYNRSLTLMKENYDQALLQQRTQASQDRNETVDRLTTQMRQNDTRSQEKISTLTVQYEKQLDDMKSQNQKDMDSVKREYENRISKDQKGAQQNLDILKLKYETQLSRQKEAYEERIRQMRKNFDEEKINMAKGTT